MHTVCVNLNFNIELFKPSFDIFSLPKTRFQTISQDTINPELVDFLLKHKIEIRTVELFYSEPNFGGGIHTDGSGEEGEDVTKLNYVIGGAGSWMHWYQLKPNAVKTMLVTDGGTPYFNFANDETIRIHSAHVGFPSLVQVAIPHNVKNFDDPRYCVCVVIQDSESKRRLTFADAQQRFSDFII